MFDADLSGDANLPPHGGQTEVDLRMFIHRNEMRFGSRTCSHKPLNIDAGVGRVSRDTLPELSIRI